MVEPLYSVDEVAEILHLHPRTVRIYINEGRLAAKKIGKEWRVARSSLDALCGTQPKPGEAAPDTAAGPKRVSVSAVVDFTAENRNQADRISNSILAALTGKGAEYGEVRFDFIYYEGERKAKCVFWGDPVSIGNLLVLMGRIIE